MRKLLIILLLGISVPVCGTAKTGPKLLHVGANSWGVSAKHFVEQGFSVDDKEPLVSLEKRVKETPSALRNSSKLTAMSRRQNAPGQQGYQTAIFFEDRLVRFRQTVVFTSENFQQIYATIRSFEHQIEGKSGVMTTAARRKQSSHYEYRSGQQIYTVRLLFDEGSLGGILQIESKWAAMNTTLAQYERHLNSVPRR